MTGTTRISILLAATFVVASVVVSCGGRLAEADRIDPSSVPSQVIDDMFAIQSENGVVSLRMEAEVMERYVDDTSSYELFPKGIAIFGYSPEGLLETVVVSDRARHVSARGASPSSELWEATGNVVVHNVIKQETMETDTLYWDRSANEIYTDSYVKMYSSDGFVQGYGMRSDDRARNAVLHSPFNSYGVSVKDSTIMVVDSVNFIGPFLKK